MSEYRVSFELKGQTPILLHNDDVEAATLLDAWRKAEENKNISKAGDDRSPPWTWQTYVYSDGKHVAIPSANLMVCLRQAGARKIMKKQTTFKEITQSGILIETEFLEFRNAGKQIMIDELGKFRAEPFLTHLAAAEKLGFKLFTKRARVGTTKHVRIRPRFDSWSVHGQLRVLAYKEITYEVLQDIYILAGTIGLCDWRPGCKSPGPFGMFVASLKKL